MSWTVFEKTIRRSSEPKCTISRLGRLQFNSSAGAILHRNAVEQVLLLWDKDSRKIGVRSINKKDPRAYTVRFAGKHKGAGFAAKTFLEWIQYDHSETKAFPCEWNEADSTFEIALAMGEKPEEIKSGYSKPVRVRENEVRRVARLSS